MEEQNILAGENQPKRPTFLKVLCILTFVATGFTFLTVVPRLLMGPLSEDALANMVMLFDNFAENMREVNMYSLADFYEKTKLMTIDANQNFYLANSVNLIMTLLGLLAAIRMWQGYKIGFHLYIVYNLIALGGIYLYTPASHIPTAMVIINLLFSSLFIFLYSRNLNWMKK